MAARKPAATALLKAAAEHHRAGNLTEARKLYEQVLRADPRDPDGLHLLGLLLIERGISDKGFQLLRRAAAYAPRSIEVLNNLAVELCRAGNFDEGLAVFDRALALDARLPGVHYNRARALRDAGRLDASLAAYERVIALDPGHVAALSDRGIVFAELGRAEAAVAAFEHALRLAPDNADAHHNRGNALHTLGRFGEAIEAYDRALALRPTAAPSLHNRGLALAALDRPEEALASHDAALASGGADVAVLASRGNALFALGRLVEARASFEEALAIRPDEADALFNLGNVLRALRLSAAALDCYDRALAARPEFWDALDNRGIALLDLGRFAEAARAFESLLAAVPDRDYAPGRLLHAKLSICDWSRHDAMSREIARRIASGARVDIPFMLLAHEESAALQRACAASYVADKHPPRPGPAQGRRHDRIRLAYLSADFRAHPMAFLMAGVFEGHDRERFETIAVSFEPPEESAMGRRVQGAFDQFMDVSARTDREVVALLRDLGIDIAIDLMGHTANSRTDILAHRVAPVQVNYLGYPGTMGADYIDAIIADDFVVPEGAERFYTERIIRLPRCFQANDDRRAADESPSREAVGLPGHGVVFCAFNNPGSVLWMFADDPAARANLAAEAAARGVLPGRIAFAPRVPYPAHLARLTLADVFLDTYPFNGGTTVSDALWSGVPVVTRGGEAFASRMAGSLLTAVGLPDLIAWDFPGYEAIARRLAEDPAALASAKARLRLGRGGLFDTAAFCGDYEAALIGLYRDGVPER
jgi:predicted O-linked N-acetylglucosamine transferase (SPINDLY family)